MKPYVPDPLPLDCLDVSRLIRRVGTANAAIARYDGLLQSVVNPSVMLSPLTQREAVLSSRIEGTQATVDEVEDGSVRRCNPPILRAASRPSPESHQTGPRH